MPVSFLFWVYVRVQKPSKSRVSHHNWAQLLTYFPPAGLKDLGLFTAFDCCHLQFYNVNNFMKVFVTHLPQRCQTEQSRFLLSAVPLTLSTAQDSSNFGRLGKEKRREKAFSLYFHYASSSINNSFCTQNILTLALSPITAPIY